jgi:hypothetical protein
MSRRPDLKKSRNDSIKEAFKKLEDEKIHGVQKYRHEAILLILSKRFYLAANTIQKILVEVDEPNNQIKLFNE